MKKKYLKKTMALLVSTVLLLTACGSSPKPAEGNAVQPQSSAASEPASQESSKGQGEALTGSLTVYSPQADTDRGPWISERVKTDLGIEVNFLCANGGEISERLIAEKSNPQADVVLGLVQSAMYQLKGEDILTPYAPGWAEGLPEVYKEREGYFHSFWQTPIVIAYNKDHMAVPPTSWQDLIKPEYKELYSVGATSSQTVRTYIVGMLWPYYDEQTGDISDEGWNFLRELFSNARTLPTGGDTDIWALMKSGEMPLQLNWFGGVKAKCELNEIPVGYVTPAEGTPIVAEAIGIVKGTKNEELAKAFVDWWGSAEVMSAYAEEFGQAPAHPEAIALCPDSVKTDAELFKAQDIDWEAVSAKIDTWFEKIELEIMP